MRLTCSHGWRGVVVNDCLTSSSLPHVENATFRQSRWPNSSSAAFTLNNGFSAMKQEDKMSPASKTFATPLDLYRAISRVWSGDTSSPTNAWSPSNPAQNHCSVTSLVVHDYFGGEILTTRTPGGTHFYNLIDGKKWDLTVSQFAEP